MTSLAPNNTRFLDAVDAVLPTLEGTSRAAETSMHLPRTSVDALVAAGLPRVMVPRRWGGLELGLEALTRAAISIAGVDAAHGWCAALMMHHPHYVAQFPEAAQAEVWAAGPDALVAASIAPLCTVEPVADGYVISGRSPFTSGVDHSEWVIVGGMVPSGDGQPDWCFFLLPRSDYTIERTWNVVGMRGTGSNTVVTDRVLVPRHRMIRKSNVLEGTAPGSQTNPGLHYRLPFITYAPLTFVAPMLGAARGAYDALLSWTQTRVAAGGVSVAQFTSVQVRFGRVAATLDAAELLLERIVAVTRSDTHSMELRARCKRDYAKISELAVEAVDELMSLAGAGGYSEDSALQRHWRDVHFASTHIALNTENSYEHFGRMELGLPRNPRNTEF